MERKRWLTLKEAATYLSVTVYFVRDAIWSGRLPYLRAGKRFIVDAQDLDRLAETMKQLEGAFI
jgi:excisionase family DNA binding protein